MPESLQHLLLLREVLDSIFNFYRVDAVVCFVVIAPWLQLYHGGDMTYEMRRRKPEITHLPTQGIFYPQNVMRGTGL